MKTTLLLLAAALLVSACNTAGPHTSPLEPDSEDGLFERQGKLDEAPASRTTSVIDWDEATAARQDLGLGELQKSIDAVGMPVMLPSDKALASRAKIITGQGWYAAPIHHDGIHVLVQGNARPFVREALREEMGTAFKPEEMKTSVSHTIVTVSFVRFGVAYSLDLECAEPGTDPRCADTTHALTLARDLVVAGGAP